MPTLPRYDSNRQLTTQQPSVMAQADPNAGNLDKLADVASKAADMTVKWSNAVDTIQTTTAKANAQAALLDIQMRAENETDPNKSEKYNQEIDKAYKDSIKGFTNPAAQQRAALDLGLAAQTAKIQVNGIFKKKVIDAGQASAMRLIDTEVQSGDPAAASNIYGILDGQVQAGIFSREQAYQLEKTKVKELQRNRFVKDMETSLKTTEENLKTNKYDFTIEELARAKSLYENKRDDTILTNQSRVVAAFVDDEVVDPTEEEIKAMMKSTDPENHITPEFASRTIDAIRKSNVVKLTTADKISEYIRLIDKFAEMKTNYKRGGEKPSFDKLNTLMVEYVEALKNGSITKADFKDFLETYTPQTQKLFSQIPEVKDEMYNRDVDGEQLNAIGRIANRMSGNPTAVKAKMYRTYVSLIVAGKTNEEALQETINRQKYSGHLKLSDVYTNKNGKNYEVAGFDDLGYPMFRPTDKPVTKKQGK